MRASTIAAGLGGGRLLPFGLLDPLPAGRVAIEASAGTGKTFTLTALATRFIAERGVDASELLIVTFTRAATAELRGRLRERLVEAAGALRDHPVSGGVPAGGVPAGSVPAGGGPAGGVPAGGVPADPLLAHLAASDRTLRLARLERAITEFDAATITTIHGFAAQVLGLLGAAAGTDPEAVLVDDTADLIDEVCADLLAAAAVEGHPAGSLPRRDDLCRAVGVAARSPDLLVVPRAGEEEATAADRLRADLVRRGVEAIAERRRRSGTLGFDDLLGELRRGLRGAGGEAAIEAVRSRYRVVLVDEFQDTDPVQWEILSSLFATRAASSGTLVLVGDPKQAIYAFRGADVHTYLHAVDEVDRRSSLVTNWRSDGAALRALDLLLAGTTFGDERIAYAPVTPAEAHRELRLLDGGGQPLPALHLRLALGDDLPRAKKNPREIPMAEAERAVTSDLAAQVRGVLDDAWLPLRQPAPAESTEPGGLGTAPTSTRRVRPSDVAVLVRSSKEAEMVQAALSEEGIPAVQARGGSVMASPAVEQWRWLLEALLRPSDPARARLFALSWFAGRSPDWVAAAGDGDLGEIQELLHSWSETLSAGGVGDLVRRIWSESGVVARVLARPDGDRDLTDLGHIGEILQAGPGRPASIAGLLARLNLKMPTDADAEVEADVAARRVESEAEAVRIMTVWVAKGLEFPIVLCPTLWRRPADPPVVYHDAALGGRVYDVSDGKGDAAAERAGRAAAEALGESRRLLYVALTRARHQTVLWWAPTQGSHTTALYRVLFNETGAEIGQEAARTRLACAASDAEGALETLAPLLKRAEGTIVAAVVGRPRRRATRWVDPEAPPPTPELALARLGRVLDRSAHRWSFTAITARADLDHGDPHGPDPHGVYPYGADPSRAGAHTGPAAYDGVEHADESDGEDALPASLAPANPTTASPAHVAGTGLALLPSGPSFGTLVHAVLEGTDVRSEDLTGALVASIDRVLPWQRTDLAPLGVPDAGPEEGRRLLAEGLVATLETPLGRRFEARRLRDFGPDDRIDEMSFELRLGEGGSPPSDAEVGRLVLRHLEPGDPFRPWAESLAAGLFDTVLAGHLTGSIDTVLRIRDTADPQLAVEPGSGRGERFVVIDYKTNRLHPPGCVPTPADYHPDRMAEAMMQHSYPLQALLYLVALHRYLRWRLPAYCPASHLGGAAYLFVRGMTGAATPTTGDAVHGVYSWAVPPDLVVELSDLLAGRPAAVHAPEVNDGPTGDRLATKAPRRHRPTRSARTRDAAGVQLSLLRDPSPQSEPSPQGEPSTWSDPSSWTTRGEPVPPPDGAKAGDRP